MKIVKRSFFNLGLELKIDSGKWIKEASFIKKDCYSNYVPGEFEFDFTKIEFLSEFQEKVYAKLIKVPIGKTITYKDLGLKAGYKNASRAVGTAMAKNKVVFFIPCHRVVQSLGGLGNYSGYGGVDTKRFLLDFEKNSRSL